jgi:hypothetical protein
MSPHSNPQAETPELPPTYTLDTPDEDLSPLSTAISLWRAGKRIDLTLFAALVDEGYDVPSLERFYSP